MTKFCRSLSSVLYENSYYNQDYFNNVICEGKIVICGDNIEVTELKGPS